MPVLNPQALIENRVTAIQDLHDAVGNKKAELDLSGGIDSAVMCGLLVKALGPSNVICVYTGINSNPESLERARLVAKTFGVPLAELTLDQWFEHLTDSMLNAYLKAHEEDGWLSVALTQEVMDRIKNDPTVLGSIRSCIRAPIGRGMNRIHGGGIRHGTGNECEDRWLRFYQKGGDGEVDTNPIAMLSKGEVYQLAIALGVPREVIEAKPSPDLWGKGDVHNDEDELLSWAGAPFTYSRVDPATGEYTKIGTIERVSRFLDTNAGSWLFAEHPPHSGDLMPEIMDKATDSPLFAGIPADTVEALLRAARKVEAMTRHKWNPNCPALGTRQELLDAGILTNTLPDLDSGEENR